MTTTTIDYTTHPCTASPGSPSGECCRWCGAVPGTDHTDAGPLTRALDQWGADVRVSDFRDALDVSLGDGDSPVPDEWQSRVLRLIVASVRTGRDDEARAMARGLELAIALSGPLAPHLPPLDD